MSEEAELIAEAELGDEALKFMGSSLFKVMIGFAEQDSRDALDGLKTVSPRDTEQIQSLQNKARFGECFKEYLEELVSKGNQALVQWKELQSDGAKD